MPREQLDFSESTLLLYFIRPSDGKQKKVTGKAEVYRSSAAKISCQQGFEDVVAADIRPFEIHGIPVLSSTCVYLRRGVKEKPLDIEVRTSAKPHLKERTGRNEAS